MPYNVEKGPYLSMFEQLFNHSPQQLYKCLEFLRQPDSLVTGLLHEFPATIPAGPYGTTQDLAVHIAKDWFGLTPDSNRPYGFDAAQPPYDGASHATTGFWNAWYGDAHAVVKTLYIRAFETALGLKHEEEAPPGDHFRRHWRLNLFSICGIRWFEGWLNWREVASDPSGGMVNVLLLTPSHGKPSDPDLVRSYTDDKPGYAPYALAPDSAQGDQGLWVVGLRQELQQLPQSVFDSDWSGLGQVRIPHLGPTYVGAGEVVVVAPPEAEGGVLPGGRSYGGSK